MSASTQGPNVDTPPPRRPPHPHAPAPARGAAPPAALPARPNQTRTQPPTQAHVTLLVSRPLGPGSVGNQWARRPVSVAARHPYAA